MSFHPFLQRTLSQLRIAPSQLHPNSYRTLICIFMLWHMKFQEDPPFAAIQNLVHLKRNPTPAHLPPSMVVHSRAWHGKFIMGNPDSDKMWRKNWLIAGDQWEFHDGEGDRSNLDQVCTTFSPGNMCNQKPFLQRDEASCVRTLLDLPPNERHQEVLLSPGNLRRIGWFPYSSHPMDVQPLIRVDFSDEYGKPSSQGGSSELVCRSPMIVHDDYSDAPIDDIIASIYPQRGLRILGYYLLIV